MLVDLLEHFAAVSMKLHLRPEQGAQYGEQRLNASPSVRHFASVLRELSAVICLLGSAQWLPQIQNRQVVPAVGHNSKWHR